MMGEEKHETREVFTATLALNTLEERAHYLDAACRDKPELRERVEALLRAHEQAGGFLQPTVRAPPADEHADDYLLEHAGVRIGRYKLLQEIGEGGFGQVFMAEQREPVQRKVALKIIKAGMDTKEVIARFEAERQALALMDHPNIARVFDGGVTEAGRPYFVMELVRGIPITEYCDRNNLPMTERLELFMQVCQAVQHAHQKAIIHRDLKPSNILVTIIDGKPMPKIIDFGVAKALGQKLTEKTLFTAFEQIIGTPAYMSPEQAELSGMDVDTRSDIYALGVLLYELLTGVTPFDAETLRNVALDEVRRMIREKEPPKPSTRLRTLGDKLTEVAQHRHSEPSELPRLVHGDLDWIVMKALEKDRARRYETAAALAEDLQRHLDHHPVYASPPGTLYRARKFVRRHRTVVTLSATAVAALLVGLSVAVIGFIQVRQQRNRAVTAEQQAREERDHALAAEAKAEKNRQQAEAAREKAQTEATRSAQVAQFMKDMLQGVGPSVAMGRDTTLLHEILDQTAERIGKELANQPEMEAELLATLGQVYSEIGEYDMAETMFGTALDLQKKLHGQQHPEVATLLAKLGSVPNDKGELKEANLRAALAIQRQLLGEENIQTASTLNRLGTHLRSEGKLTEAEALLRQALAIRRKLLGGDHPDTATSLVSLAILLRAQGKFPEAEQSVREALAIREKHFADDHPVVAHTTMELGKTLAAQGKYPEAETNYLRTLAIQRKMLGDHPITARTVSTYVGLLVQQGRLAEAEKIYRTAVEDQRKLGKEDRRLDNLLNDLARVLGDQGKWAEAEVIQREELALEKRLSGEKHPFVANSLSSLASVLAAQGKLAEARTNLLEALEMSSGNNPALYRCALVHLGTGDTNGYRTMTTRIAAHLSTNAPGQNTHLLRWACALAPEAVPDYSPVLQSTRQALASATNTINSYSEQQTLGALLYRAHQYAEAVRELTQTVELGERLDAKTLLTSPAYGAYFLTMAHARLGHTVKARECFQHASTLDPLTTPVDTNAVSRIAWNRRLTLGLLRKEAESLLKPETPDSDTD